MATDWTAIRTEYVSGKASIKVLAAKYEVSEPGLEKRAGREGWSESRRKMSEQIIVSADARIGEQRADELATFNQADLEIARALRSQVQKHIDAATRKRAAMKSHEIKTLSSAAEAAQRIGRLALGASTENSAITTKELPASVDEFV